MTLIFVMFYYNIWNVYWKKLEKAHRAVNEQIEQSFMLNQHVNYSYIRWGLQSTVIEKNKTTHRYATVYVGVDNL